MKLIEFMSISDYLWTRDDVGDTTVNPSPICNLIAVLRNPKENCSSHEPNETIKAQKQQKKKHAHGVKAVNLNQEKAEI